MLITSYNHPAVLAHQIACNSFRTLPTTKQNLAIWIYCKLIPHYNMKLFYLPILALFINVAQAQTSTVYQEDLIGLQKILQKTPSYKDQMKGEKLDAYNLLFEQLHSDTLQNAFNYCHFYNLAQLFFPIRDNHLSFYQNNNLPNQNNFPRFTGNIDSLKANLATRSLDSLEGIYHYDTAYTVTFFKKTKPNMWA